MNTYKESLAQCLAPALNLEWEALVPNILEAPKNVEGDLSIACFPFAKTFKKSPKLIAEELAQKLEVPQGFSKIVAVNGYLNFCLDKIRFQKELLEKIHQQGKTYGSNNTGKNKTIVIDYSSPNIGKELAFHHLRGTMLGNALSRLHKLCGYHLERINHLGDWGTSYGKLIVMYLKENLSLDDSYMESLSISDLNNLYKSFTIEAGQNPQMEDEARAAFEKLESGDSLYTRMWQHFKKITIKELEKIYQILGVEFDHYTGESFFIPHTSGLIENLKSKGLWSESQGAQIVDLSQEELPPLMLKKSDGSTVYATRDLCAAIYRMEEYNFEKCYYVVDNGQSLHFKQLFLVLEKMGFDWHSKCVHIPFGLILNKNEEGKWEKGKTRAGQASLLKDVLNKASQKILSIVEEKNSELENKEKISRDIAVGALVFNDLKNKRLNDVKFDWDSVLSFEGDTGPYVLNAYVRLCSILRKKSEQDPGFSEKEWDINQLNFDLFTEPETQDIINALSKFPERVLAAVDALEPFLVGQYALSLADKSHKFIHNCRVLGSDAERERLFLVHCIKTVLGNALESIGIPTIESM